MFGALIFGLFAIGIGLAIAFRGLSMFKVLLPIWGFFIGLWAGGVGIAALFGGSLFSDVLGLVVGIGVGLLFAAVSYFAYGLVVIMFGATIGYALGQGFMALFGLDGGILAFFLGLVLAAVFAMFFMSARMPRLLVMVFTAMAGAMATIAGFFTMFGALNVVSVSLTTTSVMVKNSAFWTFVWIALAIAGGVAQYKNEKKKDALLQAFLVEDYIEAPASK